jgi:hypothetical protein
VYKVTSNLVKNIFSSDCICNLGLYLKIGTEHMNHFVKSIGQNVDSS